ncbi:MAG: AraC family transcriptional regulator [Pseudomonas sp.]|nr:AraC family transcriptional regulator [Pseudomonas sp.]
MITPQLEHAQSLRRSSGSAEIQVLRTLQHVLPGGQFDIGAVAKELGASKRSLQRRVAQEGTSFRLLVTKARQELAREHLANPSIELKEVAFLLGFDDANSFYRAVRQWQGTTPAKWRAELTALPASSSTPSRIDLL